jgi:hypothetical protein
VVRFPAGERHFFTASRLALWLMQPPIQWIIEAVYALLRRPELGRDQPSPSSHEDQNAYNYHFVSSLLS